MCVCVCVFLEPYGPKWVNKQGKSIYFGICFGPFGVQGGTKEDPKINTNNKQGKNKR